MKINKRWTYFAVAMLLIWTNFKRLDTLKSPEQENIKIESGSPYTFEGYDNQRLYFKGIDSGEEIVITANSETNFLIWSTDDSNTQQVVAERLEGTDTYYLKFVVPDHVESRSDYQIDAYGVDQKVTVTVASSGDLQMLHDSFVGQYQEQKTAAILQTIFVILGVLILFVVFLTDD